MSNRIYKPAGDSAILIKFGAEINKEINTQIRAFIHLLEEEEITGIIELVPSYDAIMVVYDPLLVGYQDLVAKLKELDKKVVHQSLPPAQIVEVPTLYGGEVGPDLDFVADYNGLNSQEVIGIHSSREYLVYMLGFTPGFPYLGGMSQQIATPRRDNPRQKIPAGSVGIAGDQTGIYPIASPGGWQIIGQTPIKLFNPNQETNILLEVGCYLKFISISKEEFKQIKYQIEVGDYQVKKYFKEEQ
ncbi:5-oxoprolinase subunit PxpB [Halanaerocella petrolearia]